VALEDIGSVYAEALFEVAKENGKLDEIHEQLGQVVDAINEHRELQVFFFSPYFTSSEKRDAISKAFVGADEELVNFLELMAEKHRVPAIFAARRILDEMWAAERKRLEVKVVSAVELDPKVLKRIGDEIEKRTGREIDLESVVDDDILGGLVLRVGNMVWDASVRGKLERLRREVAQTA
jgi:F-type H+-transporting ATPase subunit delta